MSLALIFRNKASPNLFRNAVLTAIGIPGAVEILICSGYFQNHFKGSHFCASQEGNLANKLKASGAKVITVGVHNASWKAAFDAFNADLSANGVAVTPRLVKSCHWHAKVFVVSTNRGPVFAAIGSSNFTRNAFSTTPPFNYEADVLLWVPQARGASVVINEITRQIEPMDIIRAPYSARRNEGLTIRNRLVILRQQILDSSE
jgi:phosphatidylserine/phosphatidylglycerophosphate/cardiolipin synthase-like enzyme